MTIGQIAQSLREIKVAVTNPTRPYFHPSPAPRTFARILKTVALSIPIINKSPHALPAYQTSGAAGMDLTVWLPESVTLQPMERRLIPTGLYIALPAGYEAQIRPRSGTAFKRGITLVNTPGTIDPDYRGEVMLPVINLSTDAVTIQDGERIAQMIISRYEQPQWQEVPELETTQRAEGGFGHTGH